MWQKSWEKRKPNICKCFFTSFKSFVRLCACLSCLFIYKFVFFLARLSLYFFYIWLVACHYICLLACLYSPFCLSFWLFVVLLNYFFLSSYLVFYLCLTVCIWFSFFSIILPTFSIFFSIKLFFVFLSVRLSFCLYVHLSVCTFVCSSVR